MADPWLQLWPQLWDGYIWPAAWVVIKIVVIVAPVLLSVAYLTYVERKVIGAMHLRRGPNVVGPFGLLQPIADGLKLFVKETIIPSGANRVVFIAAPCVTFIVALIAWAVIPFGDGLVLANINVGILYLFAVSSLGVYGVLMAGWASNSRYAFLGALRSAAQMVSYEVSMGFIIITVLLVAGSLNLSDIVRAQKNLWFVVPLFPMAVIFFISTLAETNRHPFDMPEAEAELVAGYNVEYSAMAVLPRRIRQHDPDGRHDDSAVPGRLAAADGHRSLQLDTGAGVVRVQDRGGAVHFPVGAGDLSPLPLRSVDAPRLEGVPADFPGRRGCRRRRRGSL